MMTFSGSNSYPYSSLNPINPIEKEARFRDKGTAVLIMDKLPLEAAAMLWLNIENGEFGNKNEIIFKIPITYIGKDLENLTTNDLIDFQNKTEIKLSKYSEDERRSMGLREVSSVEFYKATLQCIRK